MGEIYKITNLINGKIYIGQTSLFDCHGRPRGIHKRWKEHVNEANNNRNGCVKLEAAIRKYGKDNFSYESIIYCNKDQMDFYERKFIDIYDSIDHGYNILYGGQDTGRGKTVFSEESIKLISDKLKEAWKNEDYRNRMTETFRNIRASESEEKKEWRRKQQSNGWRKKLGNDLPEYIYLYKRKGVLIGYAAKISYAKKEKQFTSNKLSLEEKLQLAIKQVEEWKQELGLTKSIQAMSCNDSTEIGSNISQH